MMTSLVYIIHSSRHIIKLQYLLFSIGLFLLLLKKHGFMKALEISYVFMFFSSTVLSGTSTEGGKIMIIPFWSYYEIIVKSNLFLLAENLFNIVIMIPLGFILAKENETITVRYVIQYVIVLELIIKILQLVLCRGLFEWDDIVHGIIGS